MQTENKPLPVIRDSIILGFETLAPLFWKLATQKSRFQNKVMPKGETNFTNDLFKLELIRSAGIPIALIVASLGLGNQVLLALGGGLAAGSILDYGVSLLMKRRIDSQQRQLAQ